MMKYKSALLAAVCAAIVFLPVCGGAAGVCDVTYNYGTLFVTVSSDEAETAYFFINSLENDGTKTTAVMKEVPLGEKKFVYMEQMNADKASKSFVGAMYKNSLKPLSKNTKISAAENARELNADESKLVEAENEEIAASLSRASESLGKILYNFDSMDDFFIVADVMDVFDDAAANSDKFLINTDSIRVRYKTFIDEVKDLYGKKNDAEKKEFKTKISGVDPDSFEFIKDFFDIDINDYEKG